MPTPTRLVLASTYLAFESKSIPEAVVSNCLIRHGTCYTRETFGCLLSRPLLLGPNLALPDAYTTESYVLSRTSSSYTASICLGSLLSVHLVATLQQQRLQLRLQYRGPDLDGAGMDV